MMKFDLLKIVGFLVLFPIFLIYNMFFEAPMLTYKEFFGSEETE